MHLTFPDPTVNWATEKLLPLFRLRSAPKNLTDRERFAMAVLRIAHPQLVFLRCLHVDDSPASIEAALRLTPEELAIIETEDPELHTLLAKKATMRWVGNPLVHLPEALVAAALRLPPAELGAIRIARPGIGKVNPLDWLIDTVVDESRWFIEPIDMRIIFLEKFPCADGKRNANDRSPSKEREK